MASAIGGFMAGSIVAKLLLDKSGWNESIKSVNKDTKNLDSKIRAFGAGFAQLGKMAAVAGIAAGAAIGAMIKKTADAGDAIFDMSQRTGIAAETLSAYKLAADKSGSSLEGLATGFRGLAGRMLDTKNGLLESKRAFDALGISVTNQAGELRPLNEVMLEVADKFAGMEDGATKAALAQDLFGRSGMALIPMLNLGAEGLRKEAEMAEKLGIVFTSKTAAAADAFNDSMTDLKAAFTGIRNTIANAIIPVFTQLSEAFRDAMIFIRERIADFVATGQLQKWAVDAARTFTWAFKVMAQAVEGLMLIWETAQAAIFAGASELTRRLVMMAGQLFLIIDAASKVVPGLKGIAKSMSETIRDMAVIGASFGETADVHIEKASAIVEGFETLFQTLDIASASFGKIGAMSAKIVRPFTEARISTEELAQNLAALEEHIAGAAGTEIQEIEIGIDLEGLTSDANAAETILADIIGATGNLSAQASEKVRAAMAELRGPTLDDIRNRIALITVTLEKFGEEMPADRVRELREELARLNQQVANTTPWGQFVMAATSAIQKVQMAYQLMATAITGIVNQAQTNATIAVENEYKTRLKYINAHIENEEERQEAVEALEAEYQIRRTEAQRKGAGITKAIAKMGAIVNTAEAVTKALTAGPIIGPILAGIIAALGAVQVALIAKQPIPLAEGATFDKPTLMRDVLIGEKGREHVLQERKLVDIVREAVAMPPTFLGVPALAFAGVGSASGSATVTLNLNGPLISTTGVSRQDLEVAGEQLVAVVERQLRRVGRRL